MLVDCNGRKVIVLSCGLLCSARMTTLGTSSGSCQRLSRKSHASSGFFVSVDRFQWISHKVRMSSRNGSNPPSPSSASTKIRNELPCPLGRGGRHAGNLRPKPDGADHVFADAQFHHRPLSSENSLGSPAKPAHSFGQPSVTARERFVPRNSIKHFSHLLRKTSRVSLRSCEKTVEANLQTG